MGTLTILDDDVIHTHNLATQFLYREKHLGMKKCQVAAETLRSLIDHRDLRIVTYPERLSSNSENGIVLSDSFFLGMDCVISAVDNRDTRSLIDQRCVSNQIPLIDCGTLGIQNDDVIMRHHDIIRENPIGWNKDDVIMTNGVLLSSLSDPNPFGRDD